MPAAGWKILAPAVALGLLALALATSAVAVMYPLELEMREGTNWLHALARSSGQALYDHSAVAFVNMNHGPLDPILKSWIHSLVPALPGHVTNRVFVLSFPVALLVLGFAVLGRRRIEAVALAMGLYLILVGVTPMLLVGRSDVLALTLLALQLAVTALAWRKHQRRWLYAAAIGMLAAATVTANWRFAIVSVAGLAMWLVPLRDGRVPRRGDLLWAGGAGLTLLGMVFLVELNADIDLAYDHFFGYFSPDGQGIASVSDSSAPRLIGQLFRRFPIGALVAAITLVWLWRRAGTDRVRLGLWISVGAITFLATALGYSANAAGGGPWYFAPPLMLLWFVGAVAYSAHPPTARAALAVAAVAVVSMPWPALVRQVKWFPDNLSAARSFERELKRTTAGASPYSESHALFRSRYSAETIDVGNSVEGLMRKGTYGPEFTATARRHFEDLKRDPPPFVLSGYAQSTILSRLLEQRYREVLVAPYHLVANWGYGVIDPSLRRESVLYERVR